MAKRYYRAKALEWALGESANGHPQVGVVFDILTENAEAPRMTWYGYFSDAAWERTVESLRHMGWKGEDPSVLEGLDANEVELVVDDEVFDGKTYAKVLFVNRAGGIAMKAPLTGDKLKAFGASMKERIRGFDASKGERRAQPTPAAKPATGAQAMTEKDVPF